jgi:hypothetical protein
MLHRFRGLVASVVAASLAAGLLGGCATATEQTVVVPRVDASTTEDTGTPEPDAGGDADVAPAPTIVSLAPSKATVGAIGPLVAVTGTGFVGRSVVRVDGQDLPTQFVGPTELRATLPTMKLATVGTLAITVHTPAPGGGTSAAASFAVENPVPGLTMLSPTSVLVGAPDTTITLTGSGFVSTSKVTFGGADIATKLLSDTKLEATIPSTKLTAAGMFPIAVVTPAPGGGTSPSIAFVVANPTVTLQSVSPQFVAVGAGNTVVSLVGTGFLPATTILFNGQPITSSFVSSTQRSATIPSSALVTAGSFPITAENPMPGGGLSQPVAFEVRNPAPTLTNVSPGGTTFGGPAVVVTLTGTGFVPTSTARANGVALSTTYVGPTSLTATIPSNMLTTLGALAITVLNAGPGGGTSNAFSFNVSCDTTGVDVQLGPLNTVTTLPTLFGSATKVNRIAASGEGTCPRGSLVTYSQPPLRQWVVMNSTASTVSVSAWAVCTSTDDAFLTMYKRSTKPLTDQERMQCTPWVSEGSNGAGGYSSPDSGGSSWCPGLVKSALQQGGLAPLTLSACERGVVSIQPWDDTGSSYTWPTQVRVKPE